MSFSEWKLCKVGDLCEIGSSKRIFSREYVDDGVPFYRSKEIIRKHNYEELTDILYITRERFEEIDEKFGSPNEGDMLLTSVGTLGVPYIVKDEKFYFKDGNLTWFKNFSGNLNSKYLYHWVKSNLGKAEINKITIGSTQKALTINSLGKMSILLPPIDEQNMILEILESIDSKIQVNNQINKTLENMAQAIFKQWFVDFEFPNKDGEPYQSSGGEMVESELGLIPKGWEVKNLDSITVKFTTGLNPRKNFVLGNGENFYVTIKNMGNQQIVLDERCDKINDAAIKIINKRSDLRKGDILFSGIGTIGRTYLLDETPYNWNISESIFTLRAYDERVSFYLYQLLLSDLYQGYAKQLASGSVQKGIRMGDMKIYKFAYSESVVINDFYELISKIVIKIKELQKENLVLASLRDSLLPKLLSGEIRVPMDTEGEVS